MVLWYRDGDWAYRPAGYDGWVADQGQGILTKRSFLPEYVNQARAARTSGTGATSAANRSSTGDASRKGLLIGGALVLLALVVAAVVLRRRRVVGEDD